MGIVERRIHQPASRQRPATKEKAATSGGRFFLDNSLRNRFLIDCSKLCGAMTTLK